MQRKAYSFWGLAPHTWPGVLPLDPAGAITACHSGGKITADITQTDVCCRLRSDACT